MILYLDTSALVKLYVDEPGSDAVARWVEDADEVATALISYAEARATFARLRREQRLTAPELRRLVGQLDEDWESTSVVAIFDALIRRAGGLAERYRLRGYDAVQLSAALEVRRGGADVSFGCFDDGLARSAARERLVLAHA